MLITLPWKSKGNHDRYLGIFDAPNPWGPWTIAAEKTDFEEAALPSPHSQQMDKWRWSYVLVQLLRPRTREQNQISVQS